MQTLGKGLQRGATLPSSPLGGLLPPTTLAEVSCVTRVPAEGCGGGGHCLHPTCEHSFAGRLRAPQNTSGTCSPVAWTRRGIPRACRENAQGQASPGSPQPRHPHPGDFGVPELGVVVGIPSAVSPSFWVSCWPWSRVLQARGLRQSSQLRGLAALLLPGNRGRGGASQQLMGCPGPGVYTHGGTHPSTQQPPLPPPPKTAGRLADGCGGSETGFIVLRWGATRTLQGELFAASPWMGVYFVLIYFPPFVDRCSWLSCSPRALFLSIRTGKGKCHPVLCMKGIINSAQLHLNLPVPTSLQS